MLMKGKECRGASQRAVQRVVSRSRAYCGRRPLEPNERGCEGREDKAV